MKRLAHLLAAVSIGLGASTALAHAEQEGKPSGPPRGDPTQPHDCSKAPEQFKERCLARNKALEKCKGKEGPEHRQCMRAQHPGKGDSKAPPDQGK